MRTFEMKKTGRFWDIQRTGKTVTFRWGKIGGKPTTRSNDCPNVQEAVTRYQRQIAEKLGDGYEETTSDDLPEMAPTGRALEAATADDPDDLAATMAFADWLSEQPDSRHQARSEFIRVQLQLEDESLPAAQRKKLKKREKELLAAHERRWLGWRLADVLIDGGGNFAMFGSRKLDDIRTYRRGRLDRLNLIIANEHVVAAVLASPLVRTVRELVLDYCEWGEDTFQALQSSTLSNLRVVHIHDSNDGDPIDEFLGGLPRLEELVIDAFDYDPASLFSLKNFTHLRKLHVEDAEKFDVPALAKNRSLGNLTHLILIPTWTTSDIGPLIPTEAFRQLVTSKNLPSLTHLTVHRTNAGDDGIEAIIKSGILSRLVELDLSNGCITDAGARMLAAAPGFKHLQKLTVTYNRLTEAGLKTLERPGLELISEEQQEPDENGVYSNEYLYDDWDDDEDFDEFDEDWE